jgi:hypothetical protein
MSGDIIFLSAVLVASVIVMAVCAWRSLRCQPLRDAMRMVNGGKR